MIVIVYVDDTLFFRPDKTSDREGHVSIRTNWIRSPEKKAMKQCILFLGVSIQYSKSSDEDGHLDSKKDSSTKYYQPLGCPNATLEDRPLRCHLST
jgi:hypothetical protein